MNHLVYLMALELGVLGKIGKEPKSKVPVHHTNTTSPGEYVWRLTMLKHIAAKGFLQKLEDRDIILMRHSPNVHLPIVLAFIVSVTIPAITV